MPEVPVNGVRLYYEEHGQGDPILCIHGTSSSAMVWRPAAIDELATLGRVICYDRRGCTRSERPAPYETSVAQHAEDAMGLLQALDAVPAVLIGRSYGGETAVELALRHPRTVRALVLLEAALLTLDKEAMVWAGELRAAVEAAAARDVSSVAETFLRRVLSDEQWESFRDPVRQMFVDNSPAILAEFRGPWLEATEADLARIHVPTLLVAGEASPPAFRRVTERMAASIPDSRTVLVGGGHFIDPGEPDILKFVDEILGQRARLPPSPRSGDVAEHPNAARCREVYAILENGDMDQVRALLADDIVWRVPGRGKFAGPKRGIDEVFAFFEHVGWEASSATFRIELRDVVADDRQMVALVHYHHERAEQVFDQDGIELLTLDKDGRISGFSAFIRDSAAFDEFFG